ncbi:peptide deformylase [bacterium]|nr:peptide deformylase [candidate division CSSED10-310 bacterium]
MIYDILELGHPLLRNVAKPLPEDLIGSTLVKTLIADMIETMRATRGAGLAAPQIGESVRIFVVEVDNNPRYPYKPAIPLTVVINPDMTFETDDRFDNYEGCLSVPNLRGIVPRCPIIRVRGFDGNGEPLDRTIRGVSAGTFQHEFDHLDGMVFVDRVTDSKTLCTIDAFRTWYEDDVRRKVREIEAAYRSADSDYA